MRAALLLLAQALEDIDTPETAQAALDELRGRWDSLTAEERAALTPVARLVAARLEREKPDAGEDHPPSSVAASNGHPAPASTEAPAAQRSTRTSASSPAVSSETSAPPRPRPDRPAATASPEELLAEFGLTTFRPGQREAVVAALEGRDGLVVMPTGGGKSLCYQLPGIATDALTVIVSPLIALMRDQCQRLTQLGHPAVMLASGQDEDNRAALEDIRGGRATIVFAAPERFVSTSFRNALARRAIALFVVDEAHCVSEWGHDFRPDYLRLRPVIEQLGRPPVMACTATATPKVAEEIVARLGLRDPERVRSGFDRPNLSFDVIPFDGKGSVGQKRGLLIAGLRMAENRPAVVYCGTRKSTEETAELLIAEGIAAVGYHAGMTPQKRAKHQQAFMSGEAEVVVATNAFGMGVDKADVRSVWHWALPSSLESYYQEAGRAGRDGEPARAILLASRSDLGRLLRFIREAEVTVAQVRSLVARLTVQAAGGSVELSPDDDNDRIALSVAERAGALTLAPGSGGRMLIELSGHPFDAGSAARLCRDAANRRWDAYRSIERFSGTADVCRRRQMLDHFGDASPTAPSGRCCDVCDPPDWLPEVAAAPAKSGGRRGATASAEEEGREVSEAEFEPLKAWRRERAEGKPAYTIATNATLREVIRRVPTTADELLAIKGIGPAFVEKHGTSLLELLELLATGDFAEAAR